MLKRRIIPCLDIRQGRVVKGVQFKNHEDVGGILELSQKYRQADELVFYDITASTEDRVVDSRWIESVARNLSVPFCVAGGISSLEQARCIFENGADKISINTPALMNPNLISDLAKEFGSQAVVIGIDSSYNPEVNEHFVYSHTGKVSTQSDTGRRTLDWVKEVQDRGAGEIVLNCMNSDGARKGYDLDQLSRVLDHCTVPLIASGGAGSMEDFFRLFTETRCTGALAASVFHKNIFSVEELKAYLIDKNIPIREVKNYCV